MKGRTIPEIYSGEFPLLVKILDAVQDLSIQVHPDDGIAMRRHGCKGKTEMWYVTDAEPGARIICGLKKPMTPESYKEAVRDGGVTDFLHSCEAKAGDVYYIPSGRIHSIGKGCHIAEIQESSDITYRIYDYGRVGLDGKPRELHIEEAAEAIDYTVIEDCRTQYSVRRNAMTGIVRSRFFTTSLLEADSEYSFRTDSDFTVVLCIEGSAEVNGTIIPAGLAALALSEHELEIRPLPSARLLFSTC